jgi:hypothetical protein
MEKELNGGYLVHHLKIDEDDDDNDKLIGLFRTMESARLAVARALKQPGFKENPKGFTIEFFEFDKVHWTEGFILDDNM